MMVNAEPEAVFRVYPLPILSDPFSMTRTEPGDAVVSVTFPLTVKLPHTIFVAAKVWETDHVTPVRNELAVAPQVLAGMLVASDENGSATCGTLLRWVPPQPLFVPWASP